MINKIPLDNNIHTMIIYYAVMESQSRKLGSKLFYRKPEPLKKIYGTGAVKPI